MSNIRYDQAVHILRELRTHEPDSNEDYTRGAAQALATVMECEDVVASADALVTLAVFGKKIV